jgi:hypothetical protein
MNEALIRSFADLGPNWDSYGAAPIEPEVIAVALRLLPFIEKSGLKVFIVPSPDGAIAFEGYDEHDGIDFQVGP